MPSISLPAAALVAGGVGAAGSIGSAVIGSNAAHQAANAQVQAAQIASNTQLGIFNQTQQNLQPYNTAGQSALSQLASLFGLGTGGPTNATAANATSALQNYPGYQFGLQQGNLAQQQSAASQGLLLSGQQLQAAQQYGQNYALQNAWNPYVSQLSSLAGLGESAAAQSGTIGANTGSSVANSQLAAGQAAASGIVGSANAINTGIYSGLNNALLGYGLQQGGNLPTQSNLNNMNASWDQTNSQLGQYLGYT